MTQVFKVTGPNGEAHIASNGFKYPLPVGKRPGKWVHAVGDLKECKNGLHACKDILDIGSHMNSSGLTVWVAEGKGKTLEGSNKTAFQSLRIVKKTKWTKLVAVAFAADCAERALVNSNWNDKRSWNAVLVSRQIAKEILVDSAARSAAYSARSAAYSARSAARSDADYARSDADYAYSAAYSARSAAYSARSDADYAYSAAYSAYSAAYSAYSAAYSAYSAADSAARSAADSAAYSAYSAAYSARSAADSAADSAYSAADSAARENEKEWQRKRLMQYLEYGIDAMQMQCDGWKSTKGLA